MSTVNDVVIKVATVNGTGSASANGLLMKAIFRMGIPVVGILRDSQGFVRGAEEGLGVVELPGRRTEQDVEQIEKITRWLRDWDKRGRSAAVNKQIRDASNVTEMHGSLNKPRLVSASPLNRRE